MYLATVSQDGQTCQFLSIGDRIAPIMGFGALRVKFVRPCWKDVGCDYVILGHSERRQNHWVVTLLLERQNMPAGSGFVTIICVGETLMSGKRDFRNSVVILQLMESILSTASGSNLIIVYEPVWGNWYG